MTKIETVLCSTDFSPIADQAVNLAAELCQLFHARLALHHNVVPLPLAVQSTTFAGRRPPIQNEEENQAEVMIRRRILKLPESIPVTSNITRDRDTASVIVRRARELAASIIVIGTHGHAGPSRFFLGSTTEQVIAQACCPVLTVPDTLRSMLFPELGDLAPRDARRVLVPVDFSAQSLRALEQAFGLMESLPLTLGLFHVVEPVPCSNIRLADHKAAKSETGYFIEAKEKLQKLIPASLSRRVEVEVRTGQVVEQILGYAEKTRARLIFMGVRNETKAESLLFGVTSYSILRYSPCPVWIVPERMRAGSRERQETVMSASH